MHGVRLGGQGLPQNALEQVRKVRALPHLQAELARKPRAVEQALAPYPPKEIQ